MIFCVICPPPRLSQTCEAQEISFNQLIRTKEIFYVLIKKYQHNLIALVTLFSDEIAPFLANDTDAFITALLSSKGTPEEYLQLCIILKQQLSFTPHSVQRLLTTWTDVQAAQFCETYREALVPLIQEDQPLRTCLTQRKCTITRDQITVTLTKYARARFFTIPPAIKEALQTAMSGSPCGILLKAQITAIMAQTPVAPSDNRTLLSSAFLP